MTWNPREAAGGRTAQSPGQAAVADAQQAVIDAHEAIGNATTQADFEAAVADHTAAVAALDDREAERDGGGSLMIDDREGYGPQLPDERDLYRARERVLEIDQAGGSRAEVTQARASAERTEAAFIQADDRRWDKDPAYRAAVEADWAAEMEAGG